MAHQFKKKFGQNFLKDENLLKKIVGSAKIQDEDVIEIGPGMGALTKHIVPLAKRYIGYEVDSSLKQALDALTKNQTHASIVFQDFLEADLKSLEKETTVIGNIPYNITSPIIFKLVSIECVTKIVIMIQKEVAERIVAKPNTKAYNALSVILQTQYDISKVVDVNKKMFYPVPKVDSAVIKLIKKGTLDEDFNTFVKACFKQKRKTLANNLLEANYFTKEALHQELTRLNYVDNVRAEAIDVVDFMKLYKVINTK